MTAPLLHAYVDGWTAMGWLAKDAALGWRLSVTINRCETAAGPCREATCVRMLFGGERLAEIEAMFHSLSQSLAAIEAARDENVRGAPDDGVSIPAAPPHGGAP